MEKILSTKIDFKALLCLPVVFILLYPYSLNSLLTHEQKLVLDALTILVSVFSILAYIMRVKVDRLMLVLLAYLGVMLISTAYNDGKIIEVMFVAPDFPIIRILGMCAFAACVIRYSVSTFYAAFLLYLTLIIVINLITIVVFPGGMYTTGQMENYFLGYDNTHCVVFYLALTVSFIRDYVKGATGRGISITTAFLLIIVNISVIMCMSGASVVQLALFDLLFVYAVVTKRSLLSFKAAVAVNVCFSIFLLFVFTNTGSELISFIAENVLHKDATFTARTFIWQRSEYYIAAQPIIGYGWNTDLAIIRLHAYHSHNQYLTDLYYGGFPMLLLLIGMTLLVAVRLDKYRNQAIYPMLLCVFFATLFHWNVESMHIPLQLLTFTIIYSVGIFEEERNRRKKVETEYAKTIASLKSRQLHKQD